jgi:hypothetical protein
MKDILFQCGWAIMVVAATGIAEKALKNVIRETLVVVNI